MPLPMHRRNTRSRRASRRGTRWRKVSASCTGVPAGEFRSPFPCRSNGGYDPSTRHDGSESTERVVWKFVYCRPFGRQPIEVRGGDVEPKQPSWRPDVSSTTITTFGAPRALFAFFGPTRRRLVVVAPDHPRIGSAPHWSPLSALFAAWSCTAVPLRSAPPGEVVGLNFPDALGLDSGVPDRWAAVTRAKADQREALYRRVHGRHAPVDRRYTHFRAHGPPMRSTCRCISIGIRSIGRMVRAHS